MPSAAKHAPIRTRIYHLPITNNSFLGLIGPQSAHAQTPEPAQLVQAAQDIVRRMSVTEK